MHTAQWSELDAIEHGPVQIDLGSFRYLTSAELTQLVRLRKRLPDEHIALVSLSAQSKRVLHIVGFNKLFAFE